MEHIGILGGSFNPVHIGHMMLASYIVQWTSLDKVWLTLSPQNPLKQPNEMMPDMQRLAMLEIATKDIENVEVCDIELSMPKPSYTINTLDLLSHRHPGKKFHLIIGSDNWNIFQQWKDYERIISDYGVIVYPRPGYPVGNIYQDGVTVIDAPESSLSSTFIRRAIRNGKDMNFFLPNGVYKYITTRKLYQNKPDTQAHTNT
jgi:nicotinate-nucleotide adenylyltransferase